MKTSARSMPDARSASPTPCSLPYISAVSMWRYPVSRATATARSVSFGGIWKTPKPSCGIGRPSFSSIVGTSPGRVVMLSPSMRRYGLPRTLASRERSPRGIVEWRQPHRHELAQPIVVGHRLGAEALDQRPGDIGLHRCDEMEPVRGKPRAED